MRILLATFALLPGAALAHDSFVPHTHPHDLSILPDATSLAIGGLLFLTVLAVKRWRSRE